MVLFQILLAGAFLGSEDIRGNCPWMEGTSVEAPRGVGSGEGVSPSPVGEGSGEGAVPLPRKFL